MTQIITKFGVAETPITVTAKTWREDTQQRDFQIVTCVDATGKEFTARIDFSASSYNFISMVQNAQLYVDEAGYLPREAWVWGADWDDTRIGAALRNEREPALR